MLSIIIFSIIFIAVIQAILSFIASTVRIGARVLAFTVLFPAVGSSLNIFDKNTVVEFLNKIQVDPATAHALVKFILGA